MKTLLLPLLFLLVSTLTALASDAVAHPGDPKKSSVAEAPATAETPKGFSLTDGYFSFFKLLLYSPDSTRAVSSPLPLGRTTAKR
jgi:hypothetical protein